jgi:hypothetical protein
VLCRARRRVGGRGPIRIANTQTLRRVSGAVTSEHSLRTREPQPELAKRAEEEGDPDAGVVAPDSVRAKDENGGRADGPQTVGY